MRERECLSGIGILLAQVFVLERALLIRLYHPVRNRCLFFTATYGSPHRTTDSIPLAFSDGAWANAHPMFQADSAHNRVMENMRARNRFVAA